MNTNVRNMEVRSVDTGRLRMEVATAGDGPAILFVHGIPHTWFLWRHLLRAFAPSHRVIAPDLRGLGGSERTRGGFDVASVAADLASLLDVLGVERADVVAIDLGVSAAFMLAMSAPARVHRLALMEGLVGTLPGAETLLARGAPWWFSFHAIPDLPEALIEGREDRYLDYFLANGTYERRGVAPEARDAFVRAYAGRESIRGMCDHYRAMPESARQIEAATRERKLEAPTLAIAGGVVGEALAGQLAGVATNLTRATIARAAHILPEDAPADLLATLAKFLAT